MNAVIPTVSAQNLPGHNLTADQNGLVITTEWGGLPIIPANLPDGFTCTIINYSNIAYPSNSLPSAMFVLSGMQYAKGAKSFSLQPGQSCVLTAAAVLAPGQQIGGTTAVYYFVAKGSA